MNDATRELGAALGVAVLGSVAASRYTSGLHPAVASLDPAARAESTTSLAGALQTAAQLPHDVAASSPPSPTTPSWTASRSPH